MSARTRTRGRSSRLAVAVLLLASALVALMSATSSPAAPVAAKVTLTGGGSWGPFKEMPAWQDALYGPPDAPKVDFGYVAHGTVLGRQDFLSGNSDFVISALGFSADELKGANLTSTDVIDAPISVGSLAFILAPPRNGFEWVSYKCDPDNPPDPLPDGWPDSCFVRTQYNDPAQAVDDTTNPPVRVPNRNLAAMTFSASLRDPVGSDTNLNMWRHPDVVAQFTNLPVNTQPGLPDAFFSFNPNAGPTPVNRSDGDEINYFLQQFAKTAAPTDVWKQIVKGADPSADPNTFPITERVPHVAGVVTRDGAEQQVAQLGLNGADPTTGGLNPLVQGVFAPAPAAWKTDVEQKFGASGQKFEFISVKNANGEWVQPTPDTISAAIAGGGDKPLDALANKTPGAYPFAWVDHIYVHATGLSLEKTEGLAAAIRYIATAGQDEATKVGEGHLSSDLVKKALAAADQVVQSNCTGADQEVVKSSDPGPYVPDLPALKSIGDMLHCQVKTPATTVAAAPATAAAPAMAAPTATTPLGPLTATPLPSANGLASSESALPLPTLIQPAGLASAPATPTAASDATTTTAGRVLTGALTAAGNLPTEQASYRGATLAALLLGAALFLMVRPLLLGALRRARA